MKNLLTKMFNLSIFRYVQRLAIVCLFLSLATNAAAKGEWTAVFKAQAKIANASTADGKVFVSSTETSSPDWKTSKDDVAEASVTSDNTNSDKSQRFYWYAQAGANSVFDGWYTNDDATGTPLLDAKYSELLESLSSEQVDVTKKYCALFRIVIDAPLEVAWTKTTDTANTSFDVNLYKAENFRVKSFAHKDGLTRTTFNAVTTIADNKATINLSAGRDVKDGDVFNVILTTDNGGDVLVLVKIVAKITVRFELPKRGQGYYVAIQPNNGNTETYNSQTAGESKNLDLTDTRQFYQSITAYPADGYQLYRWVVTDKDGNTTYPTSNPLTKTLNEGDVISVEFLPTGLAQFMVKGDPDQKLFYELDGENGAFKHAEKLGKKVVVVHTSGTLYAEYKSLTNGKYEFTIPAGYTLLVPADDAYTVATEFSADLMVDMSTALPTKYTKLTLSPNTRIQSNGHICVMAFTSKTQGYNGKPKTYGQIAMDNNTEIILNSGAQLTAFGYVTGNPTNSRVLAESGSTVYETFQFTDWRGGGQMMGTSGDKLIGNSKRVFPLAQYYVQSVETKLTIQHGATEYVSAGVEVDIKIKKIQVPLNMKLIAKDNGSDDDEGFFCLGSGTEVSKWYDGDNDKQIYQINKMERATSATAKFGKMYTNINMAGTLDSREYVLVAQNNMEVSVNDVTLTNANDMAFLAGVTFKIGKNAILNQQANLFVYDKEHNTGYFAAGGSELIPITYTAYHYDKYLSDKTTYSYLSGGKPFAKKDTCIRTSTNLEDAKVIVDGKLIVTTKNSGLKDGSGFYTTAKGSSGKSSDDADYGAIITSNGGGVVDFQHIGTKTKTYQYKGNTAIVEIPITNARLRNRDGSWTAGDTLTTKVKFTYSETKGKWLTSQDMSFGTPDNNVWDIRMPDPNKVTKTVGISLITDEELTIDNFDIVWPNNSYFAQAEDEEASYDPINKKLLLPITYTLTGVHNKDIVPNTYVGSIFVKCKDLNVTGNVVDTATIQLSAVEDYTPEFTVTINDVPVTTGDTYDFGQTDAGVPVPRNMVITPTSGTVSTLSATQWHVEATGAFSATKTEVKYNPQAQTAGEYDEGTLTIIATYPDAATPPNQPACTVTVNLQGKAKLQESTLAFKDNLTTEIYQADKITDVFSDLGNRSDVTFTYAYTDGTPANDLMVESKQNGNYTLTANTTDYVDNRVVVVTATQGATDVMAGASRQLTVTIKPVVAWNWSTLYFNTQRDNPVTVARAGDWTLTEQTDPNDLVTLSGTTPNYSATIGAGDAAQVYTATFKFVQGSYQKIFTSSIYADPRVLGFCVDYTRQFNDVSTPIVTTVTFDENTHKATFRPNDTWEINMIGMPDKLTFTATGNNTWYIGERASASTNYSDVVAWSKLSGTQTIQLKPTTNQVIIQYAAGDSNGTIANLCISELEISSNKDVIYFPINKDGSETTKTLILTHTESTAPVVELDSRFDKSLSVSDNLGTAEEPYYQTTVTITGDKSKVMKGNYTLSATQDSKTITITVYADDFPQGLPVKLATDDIKRYHFIATKPDKVAWDEQNREVVFQAPEGSQTIRSVTFAFEGAPSRVSFEASQDIVDNEWTIYESVDGTDGSFQVSGLANRDTEAGGAFMHNLKYTTRYVRIVYNSENKGEVALSNFVIEGDPMLLVNPEELEFSNDLKQQSLTLTAINLSNIRIVLDNTTDFRMTHSNNTASAAYTLTSTDYPDALGVNKVGDIVLNTEWISTNLVNDGMITIYNTDDNDSILAKVKLVGAGKYLRLEDAEKTGIYTGIPDGTIDPNRKYTYHGSEYTNYTYHQVDLRKAFANDGTALFDYLFVYGETTTTDATTNITTPSGDQGSNARTPYYVYIRDVDAYGNFDRYRFVTMVDNANVGTKAQIDGVTTTDSTTYINVPKDIPIRVYIKGFCPYATTGADKFQEGVFFFRGYAGSQLDVYLEDAHIFARNKMQNGQPFYTRGDERNPTFTEGYARGSGGVLVFECIDRSEQIDFAVPFDVTIHTIGNNLLRSNYGCFNYFFGMDPYQISAPVHVRLHSSDHVRTSKTTLNFTDEWPTALNADRTVKASERTNGYLALRKPNDANNAPSIDLGNPYTVVNFKGGRVNLQNAQIVSTNYKTTLAISYRSGEYGGDKVGLKFAYGIGTDSIGGMVNFYDGTITIQPMWVKEGYKNYYLIDKDAEGNEIKRKVGTVQDKNDPTKTIDIYEYLTTCLRCPKNTYVYGGSICWLRACQHVTSKGGAPMGGGGIDVGQYIYTFDPETDEKDENTQLIKSIKFPEGVETAEGEKLQNYLNLYYPNDQYGVSSITPDENNKLYFWIPEGYGGVSAEKDKFLTTWKACMTEISAGMQGITGSVGGNTAVEKNEEIKYMLYCQIDQNISNVITAGEGEGDNKVYSYSAPVKVPGVAQAFYGSTYTQISPTSVGDELQNEVLSEKPYEVTDKVFYITTATADIWHTFTAPFDVANIWVVEAYSEAELKKLAKQVAQNGQNARTAVLLAQAEHNADFAAFFGVAMAIGTSDPLETIFNDFKEWGEIQDKKEVDRNNTPREPLYDGSETYTLRDRHKLIPYNGNNWSEANFYLNHNTADWEITDVNEYGDPIFTVHWEIPTVDAEGVLLRKGETYSMLFPYCSGCWKTEEDAEGQMHVVERDFWDYWSGKFLIFESVDYSTRNDKVHVIEGSDYIKEDWTVEELENLNPDGIFISSNMPAEGKAKVTGNSTFAYLNTEREDMLTYYPEANNEAFLYNSGDTIYPTSTFLLAPYIPDNLHGMPARGVMRTGQIIYEQPKDDNNGTTTGGNMPTVGGGNDLFITSIAGGINIAVAAPQYVRVLSSTGALLFSGMVQTSVDVTLPANGVYVIAGENEVQKILY